MSLHTSHPDIIKRLKRADGHLKSIITMLEEGRPCLEIITMTERSPLHWVARGRGLIEMRVPAIGLLEAG